MIQTTFKIEKKLNLFKFARDFKSEKLTYFINLYLEILDDNLNKI